MKIKKLFKKISGIALALILVVSNTPVVHAAGSVVINITGSGSTSVGSKITLTVSTGAVNSDDGKVYSLGGTLDYDHSVLKLNSCSVASGSGVSAGSSNGDILGYYDGSYSVGTGANKPLITCEFEGLANGTTTVKISSLEVNDVNTDVLTATMNGKTVTVGAATTATTAPTTASTTKSTTASTAATTASTAAKSSNNNLASLSVSGYTISPTFNAGVTSYSVTVPSSATYVTINATAADSKATVSGTGNKNLTGDTTTATVTVTAENGTTKVYTVTINKQAETPTLDSDSTLKDLTVGGTTITGFSSTKTTYSITVGENDNSIAVVGTPNSSKASVSVSGGSSLKTGVNVVTVTVTAEDGSKSIYTINVTKPAAASTTAKASGTTKKGTTTTTTKKKSSETGVDTFLIGSSHTIDPEYSDSVDVYDVTVPYDVESLDLSLKLKDSNATYKVSGNSNFQVGKVNVVTIEITAEDGSKRTIVLNVTRSTDEDGTQLTDIDIPGHTLSPTFDPDNLYYSTEVDGDTDTITVNPKTKDGSTATVYGNTNLKEGWNTVLISVEDENGYTRTYTLNVYKKAKEILGLSYAQFGIVAGIIGGLILTFLLILLLLARRKKKEEQIPAEQAPVIDFKPEFNFGSRNGTDDDVVYPNAVLNQDSKVQKDVKLENADEDAIAALNPTIEHKDTAIGMLPPREHNDRDEKEDRKSIPYDPYDEIVTKDEIIDAIEEGLATKNPEKLKMLLEQEELNRKKEELRKKEGSNK